MLCVCDRGANTTLTTTGIRHSARCPAPHPVIRHTDPFLHLLFFYGSQLTGRAGAGYGQQDRGRAQGPQGYAQEHRGCTTLRPAHRRRRRRCPSRDRPHRRRDGQEGQVDHPRLRREVRQ